MNPDGNPVQKKQGWWKNQVNQFTPQELTKKKAANPIRAAFAHWFDFFIASFMFLVIFLFVQFALLGLEVLFTDITGVKVLAPLEALPEVTEAVAATDSTESDSLEADIASETIAEVKTDTVEAAIRNYFGVANDEYPDYIEGDQFKLVLLINSIIALLASILVFYYCFFYLISEDGQTIGLRGFKIEIFRKDGRELASAGGIGGLGKGIALIYTLFYLIFLPVFACLTWYQLSYFKTYFINGFKSLDLAIAGHDIPINVLWMFGNWIISILIVIGIAFIIGLIFHVIWLLAGIATSTVGKSEPKKIIVS